jgi:hypothetical protein
MGPITFRNMLLKRKINVKFWADLPSIKEGDESVKDRGKVRERCCICKP